MAEYLNPPVEVMAHCRKLDAEPGINWNDLIAKLKPGEQVALATYRRTHGLVVAAVGRSGQIENERQLPGNSFPQLAILDRPSELDAFMEVLQEETGTNFHGFFGVPECVWMRSAPHLRPPTRVA